MKRAIPFWLFVGLWFMALLVPLCLFRFSAGAAAACGVVLPIVWIFGMPTGCRGGAFVAFPMAICQLASLAAWVGVAFRLWRHSV
jgi:hypothetical protein